MTDFKAFSAPSASVFGTAVAPGPFSVAGSRTAFGAMRGGRGDDMDDDDEDKEGGAGEEEDVRGIQLREDSITLEQAKRIALQSAWRGMSGA